jgi:hypothetical protein
VLEDGARREGGRVRISAELICQARDPNLPYLRHPVYAPLRSEPRFQALMQQMKLTAP